MSLLESIRFILPVGTHIDRAQHSSTFVVGADWDSLVSTKQAIYAPYDVRSATGWPPDTKWETSGGPRFITFMIPDDKWKLVTCNWGCIILCQNDGKLICEYTTGQIKLLKNGIWKLLWELSH